MPSHDCTLSVDRSRKPGRGNELPIVLSSQQRDTFWHFVEEQPTGCWEWRGHLFSTFGYGQFRVGYRNLKAHRISWTLTRGPIPNNVTLDHLCRNPKCVNPEHLEIASNKENILRGTSPTAINARKTHCKRGHEFTPDNLRRQRADRRECLQCYKDRRKAKRAWNSGRRHYTRKTVDRVCAECGDKAHVPVAQAQAAEAYCGQCAFKLGKKTGSLR